MYNHLSRFGNGIRIGATVKQRQVVGYVGATGLSTGPHLDYRVIRDGRFVNPLKQTFLPGKPISPSSRHAFKESCDSLLTQLRAALTARSGNRSDS
jgi:murein DD-endopeptidase MepM/ murein hydrolase activator NlpD